MYGRNKNEIAINTIEKLIMETASYELKWKKFSEEKYSFKEFYYKKKHIKHELKYELKDELKDELKNELPAELDKEYIVKVEESYFVDVCYRKDNKEDELRISLVYLSCNNTESMELPFELILVCDIDDKNVFSVITSTKHDELREQLHKLRNLICLKKDKNLKALESWININ